MTDQGLPLIPPIARRQEAVERHRILQAQTCVADSLSSLSAIAEGFACVLVQPELYCPALEGLGFSRLMTAEQAEESLSEITCETTDAILVVNFGSETLSVTNVVTQLDRGGNIPLVMVVLIIPTLETR